MHRRIHRGVSLVAIAAIVSLAMGGPAAAAAVGRPSEPGVQVAPDPAAGNVSAEMLAALQRDLKVTAEQARARLVRADWASRLDGPLRARLGRAFAGSWLAADGLEFVVAITDRRLEGLVRASGATPRLVARSEAELDALSRRVAARAGNPRDVPDVVAGWVVDPQANLIRVQHLPGGWAAAAAFAAAAGLTTGEVSYETVPTRADRRSDVKGGQGYLVATESGGAVFGVCSAGFAVTVNPGTPQARAGFLTAAHCSSSSSVLTALSPIPPFRKIGTFGPSMCCVADDEQVVLTEPGFRPVPRVTGHGVSADFAVTDGVAQTDGSFVCTSGATSGLRCGIIRPGTYNPILVSGAQMLNLKATDTCTFPGDSGGAVISGSHAQGILVVSNGVPPQCSLNIFNRFTYYVPLSRALSSLNARLRTVPPPQPPPTPSPSRRWTDDGQVWDGLQGSIVGRPAAVSVGADRVQVFGRGIDNRLHTNTSTNGEWSAWQGLGDLLTEPPTVLARAGGIDVYYRGGDTKVYLRRFNGTGWEVPVRLGTIDVVGPITAISPQPGHAVLFVRGSDNQVKYNFTDGVAPWSGWLGLGGDVNAAPTATARTNAAGQIVLEVYARWADDNVRYRRLDPAGPPGWQAWTNLGGVWNDTPVPVTVGPNQSWLIGWSRDNTAHVQRFKDGDWLRGPDGSVNSGWRGLGGNVQSSPTAIAGPGGQIRLFARDSNQRINMITWPGTDIYWENWVPLNGDTAVGVGVSPRSGTPASVVDVFGIDAATGQPFHTPVNVASPPASVAVNNTALTVGGLASYTVTGTPGAPIRWSSTKDGAPVEDHVFHGQHLDGNGEFTSYVAELPGTDAGSWVRQVHVGTEIQQTGQVTYTVSHRPVTVAVDKSQYSPGDSITYWVTGPPNQPIYWTSTINGQPSGENNAFYGQHTDANGVYTTTGSWTDPRTGTWTKQVSVGGQTAQTSFAITQPLLRATLAAVHSSKCLDVAAFSQDDGGAVYQWTCHGGTNQQWRLNPVGPNTYLLVAVHSGKCLDVAAFSQNDGGAVYQWTCHGGTNQQWRLSAPPVSGQAVTLTAVHSSKCLDVAAFSQDDGGAVYQWTCHGGTNQQWRVTLVP